MIAGGTGLILGILGYVIHVPDFPANDIINAAAVGIVSGFAATGTHQVYHQLAANDLEHVDDYESDDDIK